MHEARHIAQTEHFAAIIRSHALMEVQRPDGTI